MGYTNEINELQLMGFSRTEAKAIHNQETAKANSIEICYRDRNANDSIVAWDCGYSKEEIKELLERHPSWYRSSCKV